MGILSAIGSVVGSIFGGPVGGTIGNTAGGFLDNLISDNAGEAVSGYAAYRGAELTNQTNLRIARETTEANRQMAGEANQVTRDLQAAQHAENRWLQQNQMNFQESMANTGFSRAMFDMKRAGLNPILAAGAQAPAPQGGMGSASAGSGVAGRAVGATAIDKYAAALNTAIRVKSVKKELEIAEEQKRLMRSQQIKAAMEAAESGARARRTEQETVKLVHDTATAKEVADLKKREREDAEKYGASKFGGEAATLERILKRIWKGIRDGF